LRAWFRDDDPGFATTMAVLDKELTRGAQFASRADDISRHASPLFSLARAFFERRPTGSSPESGDSKKEADEAAKV